MRDFAEFTLHLKLFSVFFALTSFTMSLRLIKRLCDPLTGGHLVGDSSIVEHGDSLDHESSR
jgi:hypothetical protein